MGDVIPFESICFVNHNINYETIQVNDIIAFRYGEMLTLFQDMRAILLTQHSATRLSKM